VLKKQIRGWFWVSVSTLTLAIALLISPSVTLAQRDLIPIDGSDEDMQRLFDLIYSFIVRATTPPVFGCKTVLRWKSIS